MRGRERGEPGSDCSGRRDYWGVVLDAPDAATLARFYSEVLGWPIVHEQEGFVTLHPGEGVGYVSVQTSQGYVAPRWPNEPGQQQMQLHLDVEVSDLQVAVAAAVELGARLAEFQPQEDVRVLLDPAGHPFCLYCSSPDS